MQRVESMPILVLGSWMHDIAFITSRRTRICSVPVQLLGADDLEA